MNILKRYLDKIKEEKLEGSDQKMFLNILCGLNEDHVKSLISGEYSEEIPKEDLAFLKGDELDEYGTSIVQGGDTLTIAYSWNSTKKRIDYYMTIDEEIAPKRNIVYVSSVKKELMNGDDNPLYIPKEDYDEVIKSKDDVTKLIAPLVYKSFQALKEE